MGDENEYIVVHVGDLSGDKAIELATRGVKGIVITGTVTQEVADYLTTQGVWWRQNVDAGDLDPTPKEPAIEYISALRSEPVAIRLSDNGTFYIPNELNYEFAYEDNWSPQRLSRDSKTSQKIRLHNCAGLIYIPVVEGIPHSIRSCDAYRLAHTGGKGNKAWVWDKFTLQNRTEELEKYSRVYPQNDSSVESFLLEGLGFLDQLKMLVGRTVKGVKLSAKSKKDLLEDVRFKLECSYENIYHERSRYIDKLTEMGFDLTKGSLIDVCVEDSVTAVLVDGVVKVLVTPEDYTALGVRTISRTSFYFPNEIRVLARLNLYRSGRRGHLTYEISIHLIEPTMETVKLVYPGVTILTEEDLVGFETNSEDQDSVIYQSRSARDHLTFIYVDKAKHIEETSLVSTLFYFYGPEPTPKAYIANVINTYFK